MIRKGLRRRAGSGGATMVELLLALPIVLLLGLGVAQFALLYQAKHALDYALAQAARQGAVDHALRESIVRGFAAGLVPYLQGAENLGTLLLAEEKAIEHVEDGAAAGWIRLRQRSPTMESFEDWAEPALDPRGEKIPGIIEIANDNLGSRRLRMQPASGIAGMVLSEPIGRRSGQTLADANLLRLELIYGVRLVVPVAGAIVNRTLSLWHGCTHAKGPVSGTHGGSLVAGGPSGPSRQRLGLLLLGTPEPHARPQAWLCDFLEDGGRRNAGGRIPVRTSATVRMMSTARRTEITQTRVDTAAERASGGLGGLPPAGGAPPGNGVGHFDPFKPVQGRRGAPPPLDISPAANGFLRIGSDRSYGMPRRPGLDDRHPALCPA